MTESGMEEFVLLVCGGSVSLVARESADSRWVARKSNPVEEFMLNNGYKLVKAYFPDVAQVAWYHDRDATILDSEIGYHEARLTPLERLAVRVYVTCYWDIPF